MFASIALSSVPCGERTLLGSFTDHVAVSKTCLKNTHSPTLSGNVGPDGRRAASCVGKHIAPMSAICALLASTLSVPWEKFAICRCLLNFVGSQDNTSFVNTLLVFLNPQLSALLGRGLCGGLSRLRWCLRHVCGCLMSIVCHFGMYMAQRDEVGDCSDAVSSSSGKNLGCDIGGFHDSASDNLERTEENNAHWSEELAEYASK